MKVMKWRGYATDAELVQDIEELQNRFRNARLTVVLGDLMKHRHQLCIFHVSKFLTMMRVASSIAESTHAAIKETSDDFFEQATSMKLCCTSCNSCEFTSTTLCKT